MKKKITAGLLALTLALSLAGCGDDKDAAPDETAGTESAGGTERAALNEGTEAPGDTEQITSASAAFDLNGADYVTLCDYSSIEVTITGRYEVEDADVTDYLAQLLLEYGPFYTDDPEKTTIEEGDIVDVDYVGKKDGVAFDRGSAEHQLLDVSNNSSVDGSRFIDGFTEGLIGASVGDTVDCDVTFPENYGNEDLAGQPVVFTFTVNAIQKVMTVEDVDDDFAKEQFQAETAEEMYTELFEYLESAARYDRERDTYQAVQDYLLENCTVEVPEDYLAARLSDYRRQFIAQNCGGEESELESFLSVYYGKSVEEMEDYWEEMTDRSIRLELIMDLIAEELAVEIDEEEFLSYASQMASGNGYGSVEEMYPAYGFGDPVYGETYFKKLYRYDKALDQLIASAVVHVNETGADNETGENSETGTDNETGENSETGADGEGS